MHPLFFDFNQTEFQRINLLYINLGRLLKREKGVGGTLMETIPVGLNSAITLLFGAHLPTRSKINLAKTERSRDYVTQNHCSDRPFGWFVSGFFFFFFFFYVNSALKSLCFHLSISHHQVFRLIINTQLFFTILCFGIVEFGQMLPLPPTYQFLMLSLSWLKVQDHAAYYTKCVLLYWNVVILVSRFPRSD